MEGGKTYWWFLRTGIICYDENEGPTYYWEGKKEEEDAILAKIKKFIESFVDDIQKPLCGPEGPYESKKEADRYVKIQKDKFLEEKVRTRNIKREALVVY